MAAAHAAAAARVCRASAPGLCPPLPRHRRSGLPWVLGRSHGEGTPGIHPAPNIKREPS